MERDFEEELTDGSEERMRSLAIALDWDERMKGSNKCTCSYTEAFKMK